MFTEKLKQKLALQKQAGLYRDPPVVEQRRQQFIWIHGKKCLNLSSNDYLGLGTSDTVARVVAEHFRKYGASSSSSRLVSGNYRVIGEAEQAYAEAFGYETALFFPSGFQANVGVVSTLFEPGDRILFDKHVHASTVRGMQMSGAAFHGYNHNSLEHLKKRLMAGKTDRPAVLTESLFSMDGDFLDVAALNQIKREHRFFCVVDEAHSVGVCGEHGCGLARPVADIAIGTFGKAFGFFGAFVLLSKTVKDFLMNFSPPMIYSTTLPEAHAAAAIDILQMVRSADDRRAQLSDVSTRMKRRLTENGFQVEGDAQILAIQIGAEQQAVNLAGKLLDRNFFVFPARYPTVPMGRAILRISLTALHTPEDADDFVQAIIEESKG